MIVIHTDGTVRRVKYSGDFEQVRKEIGCELVDVVHVPIGDLSFDIWVDDEGIFNCRDERGNTKWNLKATHLRTIGWLNRKGEIAWWDDAMLFPLAGNAVCLSYSEEGNAVDLDEATNEFILDRLCEDVTKEEEKEK